MSDELIRQYYDCFNTRRLADAVSLFANNAVVEHIPFGESQRGGFGYRRFAEAWIRAFPNAQLSMEHVEQRNETMCEVYLLATGTHCGPLDCGADRLEPTNAEIRVHVRELLDIREGKITGSAVAVDLSDLIGQLATTDYEELGVQLGRIAELGRELSDAAGAGEHRGEILRRLGLALDAAQRALLSHRKS